MAFIIKQGATYDTKLGPFVDKGDGVAYETGMSAAMGNATTGVRLSKNGAAFADRAETTDPAYDAFGYYLVKLDATDTNTVGTLKIIFGDAAVCLPCEANYQVLEPAVYDALFADAATAVLPDTAGVTTLVARNATGTGLTAIPWNAAWDAEVQSEVDDALTASVIINDILTDTAVIGAAGAGLTALGDARVANLDAAVSTRATPAQVNTEVVDALTVDVIVDSIPADGSRPSIAQGIYMAVQFLLERSVAGTTLTVKKPDGTTALLTCTLDDATTPTSLTRAT